MITSITHCISLWPTAPHHCSRCLLSPLVFISLLYNSHPPPDVCVRLSHLFFLSYCCKNMYANILLGLYEHWKLYFLPVWRWSSSLYKQVLVAAKYYYSLKWKLVDIHLFFSVSWMKWVALVVPVTKLKYNKQKQSFRSHSVQISSPRSL
jgi:hypothetical protein